MCSEPVTLGGGMTIENAGASDNASEANSPRSSQSEYRRPSTSAGAYCEGSSAGYGAVTSRSLVPGRGALWATLGCAQRFPAGLGYGSARSGRVRVIGAPRVLAAGATDRGSATSRDEPSRDETRGNEATRA